LAHRHRFGRFELLPVERRLLDDGRAVPLGARAFDVLLALVERRERLVTKAELLDVVWPGLVVEEANLPVQVSTLRKLIGPQAIATIPGRGYRFAMALQEADAASPGRAGVAAATAPNAAVAALPAAPPTLIGRHADVAALDALLATQRLITLVGPGGVGKSLLAQWLLHSHRSAFEHGVAWVDLSAVTDPSRVVGSVCAALGLIVGSADPLNALLGALQPLQVLVALDNAEQVAGEVARVAQAIGEQAPRVQLVVTSQVPLKLAAEQVYRLAPLALPAAGDAMALALQQGALALFVERAQAADARFVLGERQLDAAVEVCRRLDGLPLAIELAAARVSQLGVVPLARALEARFDALGSRPHSAAARQQTLLAAMQWSDSLLSADERSLFGRLGVFAGSFSLEMAQAVVADERFDRWTVLDALGTLVDHSLVAIEGLDSDETPRYRLLETARAFASQRLGAAGEIEALRARHAAAYRVLFEQACEAALGQFASLDEWRQRYLPDADNARAACQWARENDAETAVALATSLATVLGSELPHERGVLLDSVAPLVGAAISARVQAHWHLETALTRAATQPGLALTHARHATALFRRIDDRLGVYLALSIELYFEPPQPGNPQRQTMDEMWSLEDPRWSSAVRAHGANGAACWYSTHGQFETAIEWRRRTLALRQQAGSAWHGLVAHSNLMDSLLAAGRVDEAIECGSELQAKLRATRQLAALPAARLNLAAAYLSKGDTEAARALARAGLPQAQRLGWLPYWADYLALLAALEDRPRAAARLLGYADAAYAAIATPREINETRAVERATARCLESLSRAAFEQRHRDGARLADADLDALAFATTDAG
jgi:predicted ATPase/DNA-binding winged helix-turn-helix (wHTH) protein